MFGKIGNMLDSVTDVAVKNVKGFIDDPVGNATKALVNPFKDTVEVIDGLTQGEIRTRAALRLGVEAVSGMTVSELLDDYKAHL